MSGRPCPYCGVGMTHPRRVQCGAAECRRRYQCDRVAKWLAEHPGYRHQYRPRGVCVVCGVDVIGVGPRCKRHVRELAALAGAAARAREAGTPEAMAARRAKARAHRNARRAAIARGERFKPAEVFERDRWRCGLCGGRVPRRAVWPDPRSASLDHIVPLSADGEHERANVQCAHLACNLRKGARGVQQLALIG